MNRQRNLNFNNSSKLNKIWRILRGDFLIFPTTRPSKFLLFLTIGWRRNSYLYWLLECFQVAYWCDWVGLYRRWSCEYILHTTHDASYDYIPWFENSLATETQREKNVSRQWNKASSEMKTWNSTRSSLGVSLDSFKFSCCKLDYLNYSILIPNLLKVFIFPRSSMNNMTIRQTLETSMNKQLEVI